MDEIVSPKCNDYYVFDKDNCRCLLKEKYIKTKKTVKKKKNKLKIIKPSEKEDLDLILQMVGKTSDKEIPKPIPKTQTSKIKRKRCKKGTLKNRYTGVCEKKTEMIKTKSQDRVDTLGQIILKDEKQKTKKKRCPKGTHRSKITGNCEQHSSKYQPLQRKVISNDNVIPSIQSLKITKQLEVPNNTPEKLSIISKEVSLSLKNETLKTSRTKTPRSKTLRTKSIVSKSYRPSVVRSLNLIRNDVNMEEYISDLDCPSKPTQQERLVTYVQLPKMSKCLSYRDTRVQRHMLALLENSMRNIDPSIIISPRQLQSNCWFNTLFVTFFISDAGRRFFSYFRQYMIRGNSLRIRGKTELKPSLKKALFNLNLMIHKSLTGKLNTIDTNLIIKTISSNIPRQDSYGTYRHSIVRTGQSGNPLGFYTTLMKYLDNNALKITRIVLDVESVQTTEKFISKVSEKTIQDIENDVSQHHIEKTRKTWKYPDIISLEIGDSASEEKKVNPLVITINSEEYGSVEYKLDSTVLRDTRKFHFCCGVTINGDDYLFDGATYRRMEPFQWRSLLTSRQEFKFGFESPTRKKELFESWSFRKGYQMLLYYRTK